MLCSGEDALSVCFHTRYCFIYSVTRSSVVGVGVENPEGLRPTWTSRCEFTSLSGPGRTAAWATWFATLYRSCHEQLVQRFDP